jgi:CMP-N,N'-diacetyllegionaminic acid synthase
MEILTIVPARSGSKGLPKKNILPLNGHPLLSYSIAAGLQTKEITRVICSTDKKEIGDIAQRYGAEVPFLRPPALAEDGSRDIGCFEHALQWLRNNENYIPDFVINLRPTSPIRFVEDIQRAIKIIKSNDLIDSVRSICTPTTTPYKMWKKDNSDFMTPLLKLTNDPEPYNSARQDLPEVWAQTGAIEVMRENTISGLKSMSGANIAGIEISEERYSDIDNANDFLKAEVMLSHLACVRPTLKDS